MKNEIKYIIIHHSAISITKNDNQFDAINNYHRKKFDMQSRNGLYIGYHYTIKCDGLLYHARDDNEIGAHCKEERMNYKSIGIMLEGNFDIENPTAKQLKTLKDLIIHLRNKYNIARKNIKFHRDYATYKSCPGKNFTSNILKKIMPMKELFRDKKGGFYFVKNAKEGKQKVDSVGGILTVLSREFGIDTKDDRFFEKLEDKRYFN